MTVADTGVCAAAGFEASGVACGIKPSGELDLALVTSADARPVTTAAVFTSNAVVAAPVIVSRDHLERSARRTAAVVINSGNANAATGETGLDAARRTCAAVADALGCLENEVLVCSTGVIGRYLPMEPMLAGIPRAAAALDPDGGEAAAEAIRTTDGVRKETVVHGDGFTIGGMAKGSAGLQPNMATTLAVLTTDAGLGRSALQRCLATAVASTFNQLAVDGAPSTNDTVVLMASGTAGEVDEAVLTEAVTTACWDLAVQMADDVAGATKTVFIRVSGASDDADADRVARAIANCQLIKCSWYGEDPHWGRIAGQIGAWGAVVDPGRLRIGYGGITSCEGGVGVDHDAHALAAHMGGRRIDLDVDLGVGDGAAFVVSTDLGPGFIEQNRTTS
ncbi:MAG: bifunctional glutamate N-acetyltransferase/amino-acid acetyltransferase ArgJ [Actinomycetota bacterium]|nr:bifunctional glutamate N-acetyltransferase/amino-acid acetyltransferase ArgJ [Actinomycetota bacterium]